MKSNIITYNKKTHHSDLKQFCSFAKTNDFIEISEWNNLEGVDIEINTNNVRKISLTFGELNAIATIIKHINNNES